MTDFENLQPDNLPSLPELFARAVEIAAHSKDVAGPTANSGGSNNILIRWLIMPWLNIGCFRR